MLTEPCSTMENVMLGCSTFSIRHKRYDRCDRGAASLGAETTLYARFVVGGW